MKLSEEQVSRIRAIVDRESEYCDKRVKEVIRQSQQETVFSDCETVKALVKQCNRRGK